MAAPQDAEPALAAGFTALDAREDFDLTYLALPPAFAAAAADARNALDAPDADEGSTERLEYVDAQLSRLSELRDRDMADEDALRAARARRETARADVRPAASNTRALGRVAAASARVASPPRPRGSRRHRVREGRVAAASASRNRTGAAAAVCLIRRGLSTAEGRTGPPAETERTPPQPSVLFAAGCPRRTDGQFGATRPEDSCVQREQCLQTRRPRRDARRRSAARRRNGRRPRSSPRSARWPRRRTRARRGRRLCARLPGTARRQNVRRTAAALRALDGISVW